MMYLSFIYLFQKQSQELQIEDVCFFRVIFPVISVSHPQHFVAWAVISWKWQKNVQKMGFESCAKDRDRTSYLLMGWFRSTLNVLAEVASRWIRVPGSMVALGRRVILILILGRHSIAAGSSSVSSWVLSSESERSTTGCTANKGETSFLESMKKKDLYLNS